MTNIEEKKIADTEAFQAFTEKLDNQIDYLNYLSKPKSVSPTLANMMAVGKVYQTETFLLDSAARTLESIKLICQIGAFSDANTLVRKLRDDLLLFVYMSEVAKNNATLNRNDSENLEISTDEFAVRAWLTDNVDSLNRNDKKKLSFENYMKYLRTNSSIQPRLHRYDRTTNWEKLRIKLNDYVHNNGKQFTEMIQTWKFIWRILLIECRISFRLSAISLW
jgi:hypothetical protein